MGIPVTVPEREAAKKISQLSIDISFIVLEKEELLKEQIINLL